MDVDGLIGELYGISVSLEEQLNQLPDWDQQSQEEQAIVVHLNDAACSIEQAIYCAEDIAEALRAIEQAIYCLAQIQR